MRIGRKEQGKLCRIQSHIVNVNNNIQFEKN